MWEGDRFWSHPSWKNEMIVWIRIIWGASVFESKYIWSQPASGHWSPRSMQWCRKSSRSVIVTSKVGGFGGPGRGSWSTWMWNFRTKRGPDIHAEYIPYNINSHILYRYYFIYRCNRRCSWRFLHLGMSQKTGIWKLGHKKVGNVRMPLFEIFIFSRSYQPRISRSRLHHLEHELSKLGGVEPEMTQKYHNCQIVECWSLFLEANLTPKTIIKYHRDSGRRLGFTKFLFAPHASFLATWI